MRIKFEINYSYLPQMKSDKFRATIFAFLPKQSSENCIAHVYQCVLFGQKISDFDGKDEGLFRVVKFNLRDNSIDELNSTIEKGIQWYKEQVYENVRIMREMERKREIYYDFPDPEKVE